MPERFTIDPMARETNTRSFVLRVDAATMAALEAWAEDEFRSINGQLQWIIADALRRSGRLGTVRVFGLEVDPAGRIVKRDGRPVALTPREFDLFLLLVRNRGLALYRDVIYERVWGDIAEDDTRTLDLHIQRLRKKLGLQKEIRTVYKIGYMLEAE